MLSNFDVSQALTKRKFQNRLFRLTPRLGLDRQRTLLVHGYAYGLLSLEAGIIFLPQLRAIYKTLSKYIRPRRRLSKRQKVELARTSYTKADGKKKKKGIKRERLLLSIFPRVSFTKKGLGTRMGKGKGAISGWGVRVRPGRCLLQIKSSVMPRHALRGLVQAQFRLPILTKILFRDSAAIPFGCSHRSLLRLGRK